MATLTIKPTLKQHEAYEALRYNDEVFFGGGAGCGKSWLICESRLMKAIQYPGYKSFIGREELKRLMGSTYLTFVKVAAYHKVPRTMWKLNGQYNFIEFTNGSRIDLLDLKFLPSDPLYERFGSMEYTDGAIEEAGEVDFRAYDVLKSRIGRHRNDELGVKATLLITGNPKKNWTYRVFYTPWKKGTLPAGMKFITGRYVDNPYTSAAYGKNLSAITDKTMRDRLKEGIWEYDEDLTAILTYDQIQAIFDVPGEPGKKYMTIDPAFQGKDEAIIYIWNGYIVEKVYSYPKMQHDNLMQVVDMLAKDHNVPKRNIVSDATGEGAYLPRFVKGIRGFIGGSTPLRDEHARFEEMERPYYANLRSQCIYEFAQLIKAGRIGFRTEDVTVKEKMIEELQQWKLKEIDNDKKTAIIGKDEIRENIGRSTDYSDALYERYFFNLNGDVQNPPPSDEEIVQMRVEETGFDQYSVY